MIDSEDGGGIGRLYMQVYRDLEHVARGLIRREECGHTLGTHGLMHESYLRLVSTYGKSDGERTIGVEDIRAMAGMIMRRVLVDHARRKTSRHKADDAYGQCLESDQLGIETVVGDLDLLDQAMVELELIDRRKAQVVELRFFGGMSMPMVAEMVGCPLRTVERDWAFARAWLCQRMCNQHEKRGQPDES